MLARSSFKVESLTQIPVLQMYRRIVQVLLRHLGCRLMPDRSHTPSHPLPRDPITYSVYVVAYEWLSWILANLRDHESDSAASTCHQSISTCHVKYGRRLYIGHCEYSLRHISGRMLAAKRNLTAPCMINIWQKYHTVRRPKALKSVAFSPQLSCEKVRTEIFFKQWP